MKNLVVILLVLFALTLTITSPLPSNGKAGSIRFDMATADQLNADPANSLDLEQARQYMVELINRDRASCGVAPVQLDEIASKAGQVHADEMAKLQFNSHWQPDGRKPPERYNDVGGTDCVMENSEGSLSDLAGYTASIPSNPKFSKNEIKWIESNFFEEKPPNDGHRRNILNPERTQVGIGLALLNLTTNQNGQTFAGRIPTCAQEFINRYGTYTAPPRELKRGQKFIVSGQMNPGYEADCINIRREDIPTTIPLKELQSNSRKNPYGSGYSLPNEEILSAFPGIAMSENDDAKIDVTGQKFKYEITPAQAWKPGLYYFLLWSHGTDGKHIQASLITARLLD